MCLDRRTWTGSLGVFVRHGWLAAQERGDNVSGK